MTVRLKIYLQCSTLMPFGEPRILNAGATLRVASDQTGVEEGMIRLHHPGGFPIVINRKHCTEPYDAAGRPIPLLYSAAEHARLAPTTLAELTQWSKAVDTLLSTALAGDRPATGG